ncbi:DUF7266 family protein [Halorarum salinum]|uniref:Uncharacterized protein n=1 Tax=Halorarum salinum TaxID=2743089 RepID=A0A7D5QC51_9EURY|nr:hypothetical protein [Halobaculum salinum]QLG62799.1 hypothetical protein HUG12_14115 [Halobaculum salinum]
MTRRREDRAVSVTVNYVIALALSAILVSGLLVAGGTFLENRQESVTREEFDVLGEQLATGIAETDSMAATGADELRVAVQLPGSVAESGYLIRVSENAPPTDQPGEYVLTFSSPVSDVSRNVTVRTQVPMAETQVAGGTVVVVLDDEGGDHLSLVTNGEVNPD